MPNTEMLKEGLTDAIARLDDEKVQYFADEMIKEGCSSQDIQLCLNQGLKKVK